MDKGGTGWNCAAGIVEADLHMKAIWDSFENGRTFLWEANGKRMGFLLVALFNNI